MARILGNLAAVIWQLGALFTFVDLTLLSGYGYNWWNWIIAIPISAILAEIWPIYWAVLHPLGLA